MTDIQVSGSILLMGACAMQTEKAFQKQEGVFLNSKKLQAKKTSAGVRFYKKIGLGKYWVHPSPSLLVSEEATRSLALSLAYQRCLIKFAGFKTPQAAIEGTYVDKKCPFTSNVSIRGRIFK